MTMRVGWTAAVLLLGCGVATARAQDDHRFGLTMGYPTAVGVLWHVTDRIAIRPEIDASRVSFRTERSSTVIPIPQEDEATARSVRPGVSALFYLARRDDLRLYLSPRYSHSFNDNSQTGTSETTTWLFSGSIGAQHQLGSRFAVFGELGIEYGRSKIRISDLPFLSSTTRTTSIGSRSGVGVVLYF